MRVRKRGYTTPIPGDAKIFSRKKIQYARFTCKGSIIEAKLTGNGKRVLRQSEKWYVEFEDNLQRPQSIKAFTNEQASRQLADKIQDILNYTGTNTPLTTELLNFVESIPSDIRSQLISFGVIEKPKAKRSTELGSLFTEYEAWLRSSKFRHGYQRTKASCDIACARTKIIAEGCGFKQWPDIKVADIEKYLGGLNLLPGTYNGYVVAFKAFCKWVIDNDYAEKSPVRNLKRLHEPRNKDKRALSYNEVQRLLQATENAEHTWKGISGHDRAVLYLFAVESGLRASAIRKLLVGDFDFDNSKVNIRPEINKTRVQHTVYLKPERAKQLKECFRGKLPGVKAFKTNAYTREADMIKADLALTKVYDATGAVAIPAIPFIDSGGRKACFHSLRCTMDTELTKITKDNHLTKILMGHLIPKSDMTAHYRTIDPQELREIAEQLPDYQWPQREAMAATGTDGRAVDEILPKSYQPKARNKTSMESGGIQDADSDRNTSLQATGQAQHSTV